MLGILASYIPGDIISRYKRAKGFNVLHPMGYDAFGLPAEQYAIQTGVHPEVTTQKAIENFRRQLQSFAFSYDWSRELSSCDPSFYKGTQFIFLKLFEKGLAYQKEVPVNWCPELKTVLANEEVVDGKSERGGHPVVRKPMKQWMLKITDYAEKLLTGLDTVDWPHKTAESQRNWIGKSEGALVEFKLEDSSDSLTVYTTRPDTLFGATFMVIAPEHNLTQSLTTPEQSEAVKTYVETAAKRKSELDRKANTEKTGVFTGSYAINPINGEKIPVWIADYVLMGYGTGAIMAVPAHDERDFEFATQFNIEIKRVIESKEELPYSGDGKLVNSDFLNGLSKADAISKMLDHLEKNKLGQKQVQYKLRDWLFSRQRYWGEPFPIVSLKDGELTGVPLDELPITLPEVANYEPSASGEPPLARSEEFVNYQGAAGEGRRETDTMPGSAASSWYFLRYCDPHNDTEPFSFAAQEKWMPVDLYVGGPEHTVGHLLYSRFWQKVLFDCGLVSHDEPFQSLRHQGMILGPDNQKMSKSKGNVINPDEVREKFGADAVRIYISFMGPYDKDKPWDTNGLDGIRRFLDRIGRLVADDEGQIVATDDKASEDLEKSLHKTIKKVTGDIEAMSFNTAVSAMMILVNEIYKTGEKPKSLLSTLAQLLTPFAPHFAEEMWQKLGNEGLIHHASWPEYIEELTVENQVVMGVQVNGKMRGKIEVSLDTTETDAVNNAKEISAVSNAIGDGNIVKVIYRPGKILNLIVK